MERDTDCRSLGGYKFWSIFSVREIIQSTRSLTIYIFKIRIERY